MLTQILPLIPVFVLVGIVGYIAVRHQRLFLALFMLLTAFESTRDFSPSLGFTFSGVSVYPEDLVTVVAVIAALLRIGHWRLGAITRTAVIVVAVLVALGVVTWVSTYGIQLGVNSWRPQMLLAALLLYTTTRPRDWSWTDLRFIVVVPAIVTAVASAVGILLHGLGSSSSNIVVDGTMVGGRPVSASGSLLILAGLLIVMLSTARWTARRALTVLFLGCMVLLNQDRTVWIAAILAIIVWWLVPRIRDRGRPGDIGGLTRTLLVFFGAVVIGIIGVSVAALGQSATNSGTWQWRVARWTDSMSIPRSWVEWLFGSAFGPTPAASPALFATSAHSLYVNSIEIMGFVGLAAALCLVIAVGRTYVMSSAGLIALVICFAFLSYGVTYQLPSWAWMTVGILLVSLKRTRLSGRDVSSTVIESHVLENARSQAKTAAGARYKLNRRIFPEALK